MVMHRTRPLAVFAEYPLGVTVGLGGFLNGDAEGPATHTVLVRPS